VLQYTASVFDSKLAASSGKRCQSMLHSAPSQQLLFCRLTFIAAGFDSKRAGQLWKAIYGDKSWIRSLDDTDASAHRFALAFKAAVTQAGSLDAGLTLQSVSTARDGTHKLVFAVHGGPGGNVETVLIPMTNK
jgi:adenine C2-methylase RlmN of 23S rRNA A2503 and tRNA A37